MGISASCSAVHRMLIVAARANPRQRGLRPCAVQTDQCTAFYVPRVYTSRVAQPGQPEPWAARFTVVLCSHDTPSMEAKQSDHPWSVISASCSAVHRMLICSQCSPGKPRQRGLQPCPVQMNQCTAFYVPRVYTNDKDFPAFDVVQCK